MGRPTSQPFNAGARRTVEATLRERNMIQSYAKAPTLYERLGGVYPIATVR